MQIMGSLDKLDSVLTIRKALESLLQTPDNIASDAGAHIKELENMKMSLKLLQKSKIGFTLDKLRKATDDDSVKKSAKSLMKKWLQLTNTADAKAKPTSTKSSEKTSSERLIPIDFKLTASPPTRNKKGQLKFEDHPEFYPNLSPKEVLQQGAFGGTYFRPIYSSVTKQKYGKEVGKTDHCIALLRIQLWIMCR